MDADDLMPTDRLHTMVSALETAPPKTVVTGLVKYFAEGRISEGYQKYESWINEVNAAHAHWESLYRECVIASPNWIMRTEELRAVGGFDQLSYPEDYDLVFRWYENGFTIKALNRITLLWREHPDRTSRNSSHYDQAHFFELKINRFLQLDWNNEPLVIWGKNRKSELMSNVLRRHDVPHTIFNLKAYRQIEQNPNAQLLVAVWPTPDERGKIEDYLKSLQRIKGRDWWYV